MPRFLLITLAAPLASFGELAGHERRGGKERPGKAALIGLLGAALGIKRDDTKGQDALAEAIEVGVRVDNPGTALQDFHTAQYVPTARIKRPQTRRHALAALKPSDNAELTRRDYRQDVLYTTAYEILNDCPWTLEELVTAFQKPRFTLYLGRKSCPFCLPLDPRIIEAEDILQALEQAPHTQKKERSSFIRSAICKPSAITPYGVISATARIKTNTTPLIEHSNDQPINRLKWHFTERREARFSLTTRQGSTP